MEVMKIEYSKDADALYVYFREMNVAKTREIEEGVMVDLDEQGHLIGIEIMDVSKRLTPQELANVNIENLPVGVG